MNYTRSKEYFKFPNTQKLLVIFTGFFISSSWIEMADAIKIIIIFELLALFFLISHLFGKSDWKIKSNWCDLGRKMYSI